MRKRATVLHITEASSKEIKRQQFQCRLVRWAEVMASLANFEDQVEQALKDDVIQTEVDGDTAQFWKLLNEMRCILRDGVPVR